jgi:hypothetical protein
MSKVSRKAFPHALKAVYDFIDALAAGGGGGGGTAAYSVTIPLVTSATPLVVTPDVNAPPLTIYEVTSGGTGGNEFIGFVRYAKDADLTFGNLTQNGKHAVFVLKTRTNALDKVYIQGLPTAADISGSARANQTFYDAAGKIVAHINTGNTATPGPGGSFGGALIDYVGAAMAYTWMYEEWAARQDMVDEENDNDIVTP